MNMILQKFSDRCKLDLIETFEAAAYYQMCITETSKFQGPPSSIEPDLLIARPAISSAIN
jgi:hypothetical protein